MADVKQQIRKILSIANDDSASEQEVENALAIAARLMDKHHLSEEDLEESPQDQERDARTAPKTKQSAHGDNIRMPMWEKQLSRVVATIVGGVGYYCHSSAPLTTPSGLAIRDHRGNQMKASTVVFYGIAEDVETAIQLWNELRLAISALARLRYGSVARGDGAAYAEGFVSGLESKHKQQAENEKQQARIAEQQTGGRGVELICRRDALILKKHELAREWLASPEGGGVKLGKSTGYGSAGDQNARGQGYSDGGKYNATATRTRKLC